MPGASRTLSRKGTRLKKLRTVGKNPLKSRKKPYVSTQKPMMAHPQTTSANPAQNSAEPCDAVGAFNYQGQAWCAGAS